MKQPNPQEIHAKLQQTHERHREEARRQEEAMDAFAVRAVQSLTEGLQLTTEGTPVTVDDSEPWKLGSEAETTPPVEPDARSAIDARRLKAPSPTPSPQPGEPPLRAALRGIVADYAAPLTPPESLVTDLEAMSGIALDEADAYGLWANLERADVLAIRAAMPEVIESVTDRAESMIIDELVAARARLAVDYPDAPLTDASDMNDPES